MKACKRIKSSITGNSRRSEMLRFCIVGGGATVLQYGVYVVFEAAVGLPAVVSTIVSYGISFIFNFIFSVLFTFHTHANAKKGIGFVLSHLINLGLQTGLVAIFKGIVGPTLALLPALAICVPVNFFLVRYALTSHRFESQKHKTDK